MSRAGSRFGGREKREIGECFVEYLAQRELIRTWYRPELLPHYQDFSQLRKDQGLPTTSFSTALFALSRYGRREVQVRGGTTVVFRGTSDFRNRSIRVAPKTQSDWVTISVVSDNADEWKHAHIRRRLSQMAPDISFIELNVINISQQELQLVACDLKSRRLDFRLNTPNDRTILPRSSCRISVQCLLQDADVCTTEIEMTFESLMFTEKIIRYLKFEVASEEDLLDIPDEEADVAPNSPRSNQYVSFSVFVPGEKPDTVYENKLEMRWPLPWDKIPPEVERAIKRRVFDSKSDLRNPSDIAMRDTIKQTLHWSNYNSKFSRLLYIEEWQNQQDIKRYDIKETLKKRRGGNLLYLNVPGLAEKRPSVLRGDRVYVRPLTSDGRMELPAFEGFVHHVEQEEVGLGFDRGFVGRHIQNKKYYVRFDFNRLALKLMHRAVREMYHRRDSREILFPRILPPLADCQRLTMLNRIIEDNQEQRLAVEFIASGNHSKVFVIYGPPGTGKTITMVEAIHQVRRNDSSANMLVCAPSNSACDLLTSRLLKHVERRHILRMHAASRNWSEVPDDVKDVSNHEGEFRFPSKTELSKCRIIVTTLITAGRIASAQFPSDHFKYVFIDEAGQAMEPEAMIAVAGIMSDSGKIVLAGDPKQLGPVIRSPIANSNGLEMSFLERLMTTCAIYQKEGTTYNQQCVVKLLKNYRSHESIIHVSNKEFYDNELEVCANYAQRNYLCDWEELPTANFPIIFHGMQGEDKQESTSPSFFNLQEAKQVKKYVDFLLDIRRGGKKVKPQDIGVITPYRRQVQKIRKELGKTDIKVGSVEEFQGQERLVIILSTVRSNTKHLQHDATFNLGFLRNPKRFNVAVTRAKSLMIVVGNPYILWLDRYWKSLLRYCIQNGGYKGIRFNEARAEGEALVEQLEKLDLRPHAEGEATVEDHVNPQWRQDP